MIGTEIKKYKDVSQKESYKPCKIIGIINARKYNDILYFGYSCANEIK